jgi:hypothetical protein
MQAQSYNSTLSLTSALDGVGSQRHDPAAFLPGKRPGTHCAVGWVGRSGRSRETSHSPGFVHRTLQPVACRSHGPRLRQYSTRNVGKAVYFCMAASP